MASNTPAAMHTASPLQIPIGEAGEVASVSALFLTPPTPTAAYVFAHGAGAGMTHAFMADLSAALADRAIATLRFNFPGMERGSKRPDPPPVAHAAVHAAVAEARRLLPSLPVVAGGKSFGGRMTSQAQAIDPLPGVRGLVFVGFPLHPADKPGTERAAHLRDVALPMLFLQGTRDALADLSLLRGALAPLGDRATLRIFDDADHSFHVRASSGTNDRAVLQALADAIADWVGRVLSLSR